MFNIPVVKHSLKYNPALDGLRGIAIVLVVLFHIWPDYFSFGYVGVDIFFVLSGYLITQIIYTRQETDSFSFKEFYRNRIRRIFPALIIVLIAGWVIGYLFLFPSELEQLGKHIKSSAFFYQNFRLIDEVGYWDKAAQLKPLLHFWSLSIEEQFYLFWPLFLFVVYKLRLNLLATLTGLFIVLYVLPFVMNIDLFYHSFSRFWELTFGGIVYASTVKFKFDQNTKKKQWLIFILFILSIVLAYGSTEYNMIRSLLLVVATGAVIVHIITPPRSQFFSISPLVFLGLISFPLYLWHYIFISYMLIFGIDVPKYGFLVIILSVFVSYLTYRYVELYARRQTNYLFALTLFLIVILVGSLGKYTYKHTGFPGRIHLVSNDHYAKQFVREPAQNKMGIKLSMEILGHKPSNHYIKATSADTSQKFVAIIGDSHAHTSYPGFAQEFKTRGYETVLLANSSCPPYVGGAMGKNLSDLRQCQNNIDDIYQFLERMPRIEKIVFVTRGTEYIYGLGFGTVDGGDKPPYSGSKFIEYFQDKAKWDQKQRFFNVISQTFNFFKQKEFYYMIENPELGFSPKNCLERPFSILPTQCKLKYTDYLQRAGEYRQRVYAIQQRYPAIQILDPKDLYCDDSYCYAVKNGKMLYCDDDHHSIEGSILQAEYFLDKIVPMDSNDE